MRWLPGWRPLAALSVLGGGVAAAAADEAEATCPAGGPCGSAAAAATGKLGRYLWPTHRGHVGSYGVAEFEGPRELKQPTWRWTHREGRQGTIFIGTPAVDDRSNIYLVAWKSVYKLDRAGNQLWEVGPASSCAMSAMPALANGVLYTNDVCGHVWAVDMETGSRLWTTKVSENTGTDTQTVLCDEGVVVAGFDANPNFGGNGQYRIVGLNATDGKLIWERKLKVMTWNFLPLAVGDGTFVFQDSEGAALRWRIKTGEELWSTPQAGNFTDGSAALGPNGMFYTVSVKEKVPGGIWTANDPGYLTAFRVSDGKQVWKREVPRPPNSAPVVGRLSPDGPLSVIVGIGAQGGEPAWTTIIERKYSWLPVRMKVWLHSLSIWLGDWSQLLWGNAALPTELWALDAETGAILWSWEAHNWYRLACAGDEESFLWRITHGVRGLCWPGPWSSPVIDSAGTLYAGSHNGKFYALRDSNGDGKIGPDESSYVDWGTSFIFGSPAIGPGFMAMAACDELWVWSS